MLHRKAQTVHIWFTTLNKLRGTISSSEAEDVFSEELFFSSGKELTKQICLDLNVSLGFASGNIEGLGETKLTVSLGASH